MEAAFDQETLLSFLLIVLTLRFFYILSSFWLSFRISNPGSTCIIFCWLFSAMCLRRRWFVKAWRSCKKDQTSLIGMARWPWAQRGQDAINLSYRRNTNQNLFIVIQRLKFKGAIWPICSKLAMTKSNLATSLIQVPNQLQKVVQNQPSRRTLL